MEINIEKLNLLELDQFMQIFTTVLQEGFPGYSKAVIDYFVNKAYNRNSYHYWLTTGWKIIYVAKADNKIVGFGVIDKPYGGVCFMRWLGVLPEFRKKGLGKQLVEAFVRFSQSYGCHKIELAAQPEAKDFYLKCGLFLEGKRNLSYFGIDQYIYGKVINKPNDLIMIMD